MSPYKACFGIDTPFGLQSTTVPVEKWSELNTAKELYDMCGIPFEGEDAIFNEDDPNEEIMMISRKNDDKK